MKTYQEVNTTVRNGLNKQAFLALQISIVCVLLLVFAFQSSLPAFAQTPAVTPKPGTGSKEITFPPDILKDYRIAEAKSIAFAGATGDFLVVGYVPKVFDMENPKKSFVVIYKETPTGFQQFYEYLPVPAADYPMPLAFENMWTVTTWNNGRQETVALVTSWGETGADYFGTHPIVLAYKDGAFRAIPLYKGKLADDPRIKGFDWTSPDFQVKNSLDQSNSVTTILTQGVDVKMGQVILSFYGDNECHACEHKIVNIEIDLQK